jgi:multimeric flavodoxin WrbA
MAHILALSATPRRRGNSDILVDRILEGVRRAGGSGEKIRLAGLRLEPCDACEACQKETDTPCVIDDDMAPLLEKVRAADGYVFASPIYFFSVSAQLKLFLDRCYALFGGGRFDQLAGRRAALAFAYGDTDPIASGVGNAVQMFQGAARFLGLDLVGWVHASCQEEGQVLADERVLAQAVALGEQLAGAGSA